MGGCADFCLSSNADYDGPNEFCSERRVTARKLHKCYECLDPIVPGQRYFRESGKFDGEFWSTATCLLCVEIRTAFSCGGWTIGELWSSIYDEMFSEWERLSPIDCLAKLDTLEARDKMREEYREWKDYRAGSD